MDSSISSDVTEYFCDSHARKCTVIIISGDRDHCPVVRKLLGKKHEWKVEVVAFEKSISRKMKAIKHANFEVITIESLLSEHVDSCCFVEARWRMDLYPIPRNRTIILFFKEPLISTQASIDEKKQVNKLLKQYAKEITKITGIPCCYHLRNREPNVGRLVYIIGCNCVGKDGSKIDFFRICCREKRHELNEKCFEICEQYEKFSTMMESDTPTNDIELGNRFAALEVEVEELPDNEILSHIYDDDDIATIKAIESREQENKDTERSSISEEDSDTEGFTEVKSSSEARKVWRKYSAYCQFGFKCTDGRKCAYTHTEEQKVFFEAHRGVGCTGYKSKPCGFYINGYCWHGGSKTVKCAYYHSKEEARCYVCEKIDLEFIGHASHDHEVQ